MHSTASILTLPFPVSHITPLDPLAMERHYILAHRTDRAEADRFRILRTHVLQAMAQAEFRTLGITSPRYGDGKTTIALNLALSIAHDLNQTVLLVDLDLRKPSVCHYLGLEAAAGVTDYFLKSTPLASCLLRTSFPRLTVLPAGMPLPQSAEILSAPKITALAHELRERYPDRLIIYDLPPVLAQADPLVFAPQLDSFLLVLKEGKTCTEDAKTALRSLNHTHVFGTVLNYSADRAETNITLKRTPVA